MLSEFVTKGNILHAHDLLALFLLALPHVLVIIVGEVCLIMGSVAMVALQVSHMRLLLHQLNALSTS